MLHLLAQTQDANGWNVTTSIAAVGAVISLLTLLVTTWATGQRERAKWARETLAEAFFDFVNSSYDAGQAGRDYFAKATLGAEPDELSALLSHLDKEIEKLLHVQTRIRLLAPRRTLESARELRWKIADLRGSLNRNADEDEHQRLVVAIAEAREDFVQRAKGDMSLPR